MENVRLGLVGCGWFGGVLTKSAQASGLSDVVSCFARSEDSRRAFAQAHGCRAADSLDAMLSDPEVEAILVVTPHSTHTEIVEQIASAGKHVFVEKPLTLTVAEARRAIDATGRAGVILQVGQNRRRQPANRRIKAMLDAGELGTVMQLEAMHAAPGALSPDLAAWRRDASESPLGGMAALGVHEVDTFNYLAGPAARVAAFSKRIAGLTRHRRGHDRHGEFESGLSPLTGHHYVAPVVVRWPRMAPTRRCWRTRTTAGVLAAAAEAERARAGRHARPDRRQARGGRAVHPRGMGPETGGPRGTGGRGRARGRGRERGLGRVVEPLRVR